MKKPASRSTRWAEAVGAARDALSAIDEAYANLESALEDLRGVKEEYEEWQGNLPENLAGSALGEKLQAVVDLDIPDDSREVSYSELESALDEAEGIDLPLGFGRD
jgi:hypothetical protein